MKTAETKQPEPAADGKSKYSTPQLTDYGALTELTQGGTLLGNDGNTECTGNSNSAENPCAPS
jgi:hypothetical protein